jgi:hypothetical protein
MAAKDNQGLQAIIIVLALLVMGLGVGLLVVNNSKKTAQARARDAEGARDEARKVQTELTSETNNYKQWIGFSEADSYASVQETQKEDMARYGSNFEEANRNYRTILDSVFEENRKLTLNESSAKQQVRDLKESLLAVETQKEKQLQEYQQKMEQTAADAAAEKNKFDTQYAQINTEKDRISQEMQKLQDQFDEKEKEFAQLKASLEQEIRKLEGSIVKLREGLPEVDKFAQPADGRITWVNQRHGLVWIDLGSDDGIRPQVTFSVSNALDADPEKAEKKGSIEVLRVIDAHMSEARITEDSATNPLIPGDQIYSQVWDRGRKVGFGIAGFIDFDGDGKSDLEQLKRVIAASNGRVDASPDETGAKQGEMQIDTRFLVLGEYPDDPRLKDFRTSWDQIGDEADQLGIETIALQEFLKLMGWQNETRAATMGSAARAEDFPTEPIDNEQPRKQRRPTGIFERSLPKVSY